VKKRFIEAQIIGFLREGASGVAIKDLCRRHGFSEASYYLWRGKFGGMSVSDAKRLKEFETENTRLKKLLDGERVNHRRVDRLYAEARLQVRRRRRKKIPVADRQPLVRPLHANVVWSADFVFDRTAEGRVLKCLTVVDGATTEAVAIVPARALGGLPVTRAFDRLALERGLPTTLRA
jgi:putative transposase